MKPLLSIVIVEYNSIDEIKNCVESLFHSIKIPFEVIVSSNSCYGEVDQTGAMKAVDAARWIFNPRNGGFAYAMNQGLKAAQGDYLVIMNSDCSINFDLSKMVSFMQEHKELGAAGPRIHDTEGNIQDTARPYVSVPRFFWRQFKRMLLHKVSVLNPLMDYDKTQTVDWVIGAFIMVSREAYELAGGLDEAFFMYAEDLDWCTRIRKSGFEVAYFSDSDVTYKGTRRARNSKKYAKIFLRSHYLYWRKYGFICGYPKRKKILYESTLYNAPLS